MVSRIDPSRPGTIFALGWDVRQQLANARADIEDLQAGGAGGPYLPLSGASIPVGEPGDIGFKLEVVGGELDLLASGDNDGSAWLYTGDNDGTVGSGATGVVGVGTGNSETAISGAIWIYTGDAAHGTGQVGISTGRVTSSTVTPAGSSGNLDLTTGDAAGSGESGAIILRTGAVDAGSRGNVTVGGRLVILETLPTANPNVLNALWLDVAAGRVLKVSAG